MDAATIDNASANREQLLHSLYEASELEHNLMCTYLYAAFSLKSGESEGLDAAEAAVVQRWRRAIIDIAIEEMGHLAAVWNITAAIGGAPRFGRGNFPLDPGYLPAGVVVKLSPFNPATLQHFIFLERPNNSPERDGEGFSAERPFTRAVDAARLTPTAMDYATVGEFYGSIGAGLRALVEQVGEAAAFCGDPALQLSKEELDLGGVKPVICLKTALSAFDAIVAQGEGAPEHSNDSHFQKFVKIRDEYRELLSRNPGFKPGLPAATNPVLRRPPRPEGRVWIEDAEAGATVDLANAAYGLMLRLIAYSYSIRGPSAEKALSVDLAIGLMQTVTLLAERAARLPAGPSNPECHAGMSFTALRDAASLPQGPGARRLFIERFSQFAAAGAALDTSDDPRTAGAHRGLAALAARAARGFELAATAAREPDAAAPSAAAPNAALTTAAPPAALVAGALAEAANGHSPSAPIAAPSTDAGSNGIETVAGAHLTLLFEARRCIHARFCVTGAPKVFLANVKGPWIHPDAMDAERLVDIAHACPSGAIRYRRVDGRPDETAPPVNLASIREAGPYAFRGDLQMDGIPTGYRATLCRCGASKNKPFCDSSHHDVNFTASGEPASTTVDMLPERAGPLQITPEMNGPLRVRGNLEITSGTGRVVARVTGTRLCRCGGSQTKPFCDGTHARIGFSSLS
jgi:CDGSH-type Zn-finger protein/uncharacterized Fe-S cluster protein YjdI